MTTYFLSKHYNFMALVLSYVCDVSYAKSWTSVKLMYIIFVTIVKANLVMQMGLGSKVSSREDQTRHPWLGFKVLSKRLEEPWIKAETLVCKMSRQVAQRATIAHLSPMCQSQISFQKKYKWAMETRDPKSNSSELLCLSWLPATLMMIRLKMNELAWRHHFPITSLWEIF